MRPRIEFCVFALEIFSNAREDARGEKILSAVARGGGCRGGVGLDLILGFRVSVNSRFAAKGSVRRFRVGEI